MKGKGSLFLKKKLQSVIFKLVVEDTALNAYHNPLQIIAQMVDEVAACNRIHRYLYGFCSCARCNLSECSWKG